MNNEGSNSENKIYANMVDFNAVVTNYDESLNIYTVDQNYFNNAFFWHTVSFRGSDGVFTVGKIYQDLFSDNSLNGNMFTHAGIPGTKVDFSAFGPGWISTDWIEDPFPFSKIEKYDSDSYNRILRFNTLGEIDYCANLIYTSGR